MVSALMAPTLAGQESKDVPVTIKELDVEGAIKEFQSFQLELERYRKQISEGQSVAAETAQILDDLRASAAPENNYNEEKILEAIHGYIDGVVAKQIELVDFLESQRYRISYYANKMAASVSPQDLALCFGTEEQNVAAVEGSVRAVDAAQRAIADFIDALPAGQFDRQTFRPLPSMPAETRSQLDSRLLGYQQARNALELGKRRLQLVREAQRRTSGGDVRASDINPDLLLGEMFGSLDMVRLQMSVDLLYLENFLGQYARSARTQEILQAFQRLVELQGGLQGPSPGLASVLDWLQASSTRRLSLGLENLNQPGVSVPRSSDLLREAYRGARGGTRPEDRSQP